MKLKRLGQKFTFIVESVNDPITSEALSDSVESPSSVSIDLNQLKISLPSGTPVKADSQDTDTVRLIGNIGRVAQWCNEQGVAMSLICSSPKLLNLLMTSNIQQLCRLQPFKSGCPQHALLS